MKKIIILTLVLTVILATSITAFAFTETSPVEILAGLTGKTTGQLADIKYASGKSYGQIAYNEGQDVWEDFMIERFENKKALIKERLTDGSLSQEEADEFLAYLEEMQDFCLENSGCFGIMKDKADYNGFGMGKYFDKDNNRGMRPGFGRCGRGSW